MNRPTLALITPLIALISTAPSPVWAAQVVLDLATLEVPVLTGGAAEEQFGTSTAAGDFDGDGRMEIAVGAPGAAAPGGAPHRGAVYVFEDDVFDSLPPDTPAADVAALVIRGRTEHGRFGMVLAAGDVDGDGIDDLLVGAPEADVEGRVACGAVFVFRGGMSATWGDGPDESVSFVLSGTTSGDRLGSSLFLGDVDGDGAPELLVSAPRAGHPRWSGIVYVLRSDVLGDATGQMTVSQLAHASVAGGNRGDALRGLAVGDVDGDGRAEVIVGAYHGDPAAGERTDAGVVHVLESERLSPGERVVLPAAGATAPGTIGGPERSGFFGGAIAVGDVDSDGVDDLVIGAYASRAGGKKIEATGEVYLLVGGQELNGEAIDLRRSGIAKFESRSRWDLFGLPILVADLNGDGADDIIISAQFADSPGKSREKCGEVYIYRGSLRSVVAAKAGGVELADVVIVGAEEQGAFGGSLLALDAVSGTGVDLVIGAPDAASSSGEPRAGKLYAVSDDLLTGSVP